MSDFTGLQASLTVCPRLKNGCQMWIMMVTESSVMRSSKCASWTTSTECESGGDQMESNGIEKLEKKNLLSNNVINMHIWIMF